MASITFEGLNPLNPSERATTVVNMDDQAMVKAVTAICANHDYQPTIPNPDYDPEVEGSQPVMANPEGPGTFAIKRIMDYCIDEANAYKVNQVIPAAVSPVVDPINEEFASLADYTIE